MLMLKRLFTGARNEKKVKQQRPRVFAFTDFRIRYRVNGQAVEMYDDKFEMVTGYERRYDAEQTYLCRKDLNLYGYSVEFSVKADAYRMFLFYFDENALINQHTNIRVFDTLYFPQPSQLDSLIEWTAFCLRLKTRLTEGYQVSLTTSTSVSLSAGAPRDPDNPEESMYAVNSRAPELLSRADFVLAALGCDKPIK
jgi:hypothetical protein